MTGGGDLDEVRDDDDAGAGSDPGKEVDPADGGFLNDPDPTAGASDVGGRAGGDDDTRGEDGHEVGGGQTGMGKGPTGS